MNDDSFNLKQSSYPVPNDGLEQSDKPADWRPHDARLKKEHQHEQQNQGQDGRPEQTLPALQPSQVPPASQPSLTPLAQHSPNTQQSAGLPGQSRKQQHLIRTPDIYQTPKDKDLSAYGDRVFELMHQSVHTGIPKGCNCIAMTGKNKKGTTAMQLFGVVEGESFDDARFVRVGYRVHGCVAMIAIAAYLGQRLEGMMLTEALAIDVDELTEQVGKMPADKAMTRHIGVEAMRALVGDWLYRQGLSWQTVAQITNCDPYRIGCLICEDCSLRSTLNELRFS